MSHDSWFETIEHECAEEGRTAHLVVEWEERDGQKRVKGVQCDNPRLATLDNWECCWSCWSQLESGAEEA